METDENDEYESWCDNNLEYPMHEIFKENGIDSIEKIGGLTRIELNRMIDDSEYQGEIEDRDKVVRRVLRRIRRSGLRVYRNRLIDPEVDIRQVTARYRSWKQKIGISCPFCSVQGCIIIMHLCSFAMALSLYLINNVRINNDCDYKVHRLMIFIVILGVLDLFAVVGNVTLTFMETVGVLLNAPKFVFVLSSLLRVLYWLIQLLFFIAVVVFTVMDMVMSCKISDTKNSNVYEHVFDVVSIFIYLGIFTLFLCGTPCIVFVSYVVMIERLSRKHWEVPMKKDEKLLQSFVESIQSPED